MSFYDVGKKEKVTIPSRNISKMTRITNGKNGRRKITLAKGKTRDGRFVYKIIGNQKA